GTAFVVSLLRPSRAGHADATPRRVGMRLSIMRLVVVGVAIASAPAAAQQSKLPPTQSDELASTYQAWQQARDTEEKIGFGERADNQETAIAHFEAAQTVFSREAAPELWGQLQNNLAIVYWSRIKGDHAENVEEAIGGFEAALTVITREKDPDRWAAAQNNL